MTLLSDSLTSTSRMLPIMLETLFRAGLRGLSRPWRVAELLIGAGQRADGRADALRDGVSGAVIGGVGDAIAGGDLLLCNGELLTGSFPATGARPSRPCWC